MDEPIQLSDPRPLTPADREIAEIEFALADLNNAVLSKVKDDWHKAGVASQFLSGFVIAFAGIFVTAVAHNADLREKQTELRLAD
jgi:hypothetical protein